MAKKPKNNRIHQATTSEVRPTRAEFGDPRLQPSHRRIITTVLGAANLGCQTAGLGLPLLEEHTMQLHPDCFVDEFRTRRGADLGHQQQEFFVLDIVLQPTDKISSVVVPDLGEPAQLGYQSTEPRIAAVGGLR